MKKKILLPCRKYSVAVLIVLVSILLGQHVYGRAQVQAEKEEPLEERMRKMEQYLQAKARDLAKHLGEEGAVEELQKLLDGHDFFTGTERRDYLFEAKSKAGRLRPGFEYRDCADCPQMVVLPAGEFLMGDLDGSGLDTELPVHRVTISRPFAVSKYEITFAQWDACVLAGGCKYYPKDIGWGRGQSSVINISWNDINKEYIPWLTRKTGKNYRLLTEAEWEYAARAGTRTKYSWGNKIGKNKANCVGCGAEWDGKQTASVGSFAANKFGLYDMHGNASEWVQDCWNDSYEGVPTDGSAWQTGDCSRVSIRGGSWFDLGKNLRASSRDSSGPAFRHISSGLRLGQDL